MNLRAGVTTYRGKKKTSQTLRKEANKGVTYASWVGLNLNPSNNHQNTSPLAFDLPSDISVNELKRCEELAPHTHQYRKTVNLSFDLSKNDYSILFDTETTCTVRPHLYRLGYPRQPSPRVTLDEVTFGSFLCKINQPFTLGLQTRLGGRDNSGGRVVSPRRVG